MPLLSTFASSAARAIRAGISLLPPNVPTSFSATGVSADSDTGGAVISFSAPDTEGGLRPITSYQVENQNTGVITTISGSGQTVPLTKNNTHTFRIRAVNSVGNSAWSSTDTALSFRQSYGGENGYYSSSTVYVSLPANVTINYSLSSGAGSTSTPDTRTYGTVYAVTEWFGFSNFFAGPYVPGQVAYTPGGLDGYYWYGYVGSYSVVYDGYFSYAGFSGYPYEEYYYGYAPNFTFGVYAFPAYGVTGGSAPRGPDYGSQSYLYNNSLGYASPTIASTQLGYNLSPNTVTGTFSGYSQIRFDFGSANYNYWYGGVEAYYGPSGRGRIWYGT